MEQEKRIEKLKKGILREKEPERSAQKERVTQGEDSQHDKLMKKKEKSTIKDKGRVKLCIGVTRGQNETNLEGRRCQTDTSSTYLHSDLLYLSHSSVKTN